jgi:hypothetical protein
MTTPSEPPTSPAGPPPDLTRFHELSDHAGNPGAPTGRGTLAELDRSLRQAQAAIEAAMDAARALLWQHGPTSTPSVPGYAPGSASERPEGGSGPEIPDPPSQTLTGAPSVDQPRTRVGNDPRPPVDQPHEFTPGTAPGWCQLCRRHQTSPMHEGHNPHPYHYGCCAWPESAHPTPTTESHHG